MVLLCGKSFHHMYQHPVPGFRKDSANPGGFPVCICQVYRGAQGVYFILALPDMVVEPGLILVPDTAGALIKSIGVRVNTYQLRLLFNHPFQDFLEFLIFLCKPHIGTHLGRRIPQPHGRDVPGDHKITAVLQLFHRGFHGV